MMGQQNQIDWRKLGNPRITVWLQEALSDDKYTCSTALNELKDAVAPWELLDGYGSTTDLMKMSESPVPEALIPFFIQLLKSQDVKDKVYLLEILYDLARYVHVSDDFIPRDKRQNYLLWANRLRSLIAVELDFYQTLLNDSSLEVRQEAEALIRILAS